MIINQLSCVLLLASILIPVTPFDADPSVCIVQYDSTTNTFSENLLYDSTSPPELYAYVCTKNYGSCGSLKINLLPSGGATEATNSQAGCYKGEFAPTLTVGSSTPITSFFSKAYKERWSNKCSPLYYTYGMCDLDPTTDREDVTIEVLFPDTTSSSVLRLPTPSSNICPEQRCNQANTASYSWWRTVNSFTVDASGTHEFSLRGMVKDNVVHTHDPSETKFAFTLGATVCPPGNELALDTTCKQCIVGKYKTDTSPNACMSCRAGLYGIGEGAISIATGCSECPAGRYGSGEGVASVDFCVLCSAGKYCEADSQDNLLLCDAGRHGALGESSALCSSGCPAGTWCNEGTAIGSEHACGTHPSCTDSTSICYCPAGSIQPVQALSGEFTYGSSPSGTTNRHTSAATCQPGTYCVLGVNILCPAGTYCVGFSRASSGPLCAAGFLCPEGSSSKQQQACSDGTTCDKYCPEGTTTTLATTSGYYTTPIDAPCSEKSGVENCPDDAWCFGGVKNPKLEWRNEVLSCGGDLPHELSLSVNEGNPLQNMVNLDVLEHQQEGTNSPVLTIGSSGLSIGSSKCLDNDVPSSPFEIVAGVGTNAVPVLRTKSQTNGGAVQYTACRKYEIIIQASNTAGSFVTNCKTTISITDINNAPTWLSSSLVERTIRERSPRGTTVTTSSAGQLAESIIALDDDIGQEITYEVISTTPSNRAGVLSVTRCGGVITVQSADLVYPEEVTLCIRACDDPTFFGSNSGAALCIPSSTTCTNIVVKTENVNDPPIFSSTNKCSTSSPCIVPERTAEGEEIPNAGLSDTATDDDGDTLKWHLSTNGDDAFTIGLLDGKLYAGSAATDFETTRSYVFEIMVTDDSIEQSNCVSSWCETLGRCCAKRQVRIDVSDVNDAPVWPVGFANTIFTVNENTPINTAIGTAFIAADQDFGQQVTYTVDDKVRTAASTTQRVKVDNVASGTSSLGQLQVNAVIDYEDVSFFLIDLIATDNASPTPATALVVDIRINVIDVNEPTTISDKAITMGENEVAGYTLLNMNTDISYTDPDEAVFGVDLSYSILTSASSFHVSSTSNLLLLLTTVNFETLTTNPIVLDYRGVQKDDSTLQTNTAQIRVTITDENEAPVGNDVQVTLNEYVVGGSTVDSSVVVTVTATDPDNSDVLSWILPTDLNSAYLRSTFSLASATGVLTVATAINLNYEDTPIIYLVARVTDAGNLFDDVDIQITLLDQNDQPTITTDTSLSCTVTTDGTNTACTAANADQATCDAATTSGGGGLPANNCVFTSTWFTVSKHSSGAGSEFGRIGGVVDSLLANDEDDSSLANGIYTFSLVESFTPYESSTKETDGQITFAVAPDDGRITVALITTALETEDATFKLTVQVTDQGTPPVSSQIKNIYIKVVAENFRPAFSGLDEADKVTVSLNETDPAVLTVHTMSATDVESDDAKIIYTISSVLPDLRGADAQRAFSFDLDTVNNPGKIVLNDGFTLDFETTKWQEFEQGVVHIVVQAMDENGAVAVATCIINILDVNEPPTLSSKQYSIGEDLAANSALGNGVGLSASDLDATDKPNADKLSYSFASGTHPTFVVGATGATGGIISTSTTLDYETVASYNLAVTVSDTASLSTTASVTIAILNINESPSLSDLSVSVLESSPAGSVVSVVPAVDPDSSSMTDLTFSVQSITPSNVASFILVKASPTSAYLRHDGGLDYEKVTEYTITVQVNDGGENFPFQAPQSGGGVVSLTSTGIVTVEIVDVNDMDVTSVEVGGVVGASHPTQGGTSVNLLGINLGPKDSSPSSPPTLSAKYGPPEDPLRYTASSCEFQVPYGSKVSCVVSEGSGAELLWTLTIGAFNVTTRSSRTSYTAPTISSVENAQNMPTTGGVTIAVVGTSFGPAGAVNSGNTNNNNNNNNNNHVEVQYGTPAEFQAERWHVATGCQISVAHTKIECTTVEATGKGLQWRVTVNGQNSLLYTDALSGHAPPNVVNVAVVSAASSSSSSSSVDLITQLDTLGGQTIELIGDNFGADALSRLSVLYGTFIASSCTVVESHTRIRCITVPGCGKNLQWTVTVGPSDGFPVHASNSVGILSTTLVSYSAPTLSSVSGDNVYTASTSGDDFVLLRGTGFGIVAGCNSECRTTGVCGQDVGVSASYLPVTSISATKYAARCCEVLSDTSMQCLMAPGAGRDLQWNIDVCGQESTPLDTITAYGPPVIGSYGAAGSGALQTEGGEIITLNGINFGPAGAGHIQGVSFGSGNGTEHILDPTACSVTVSHQQITCTTTKGGGKNHKWSVDIAGQKSTVPTTSYLRPTIDTIVGEGATDASMDGGEEIILNGENFGPLPSFGEGIIFLDSVHYGTRADPYLYLAKECEVITSSIKIRCKTVPGSGRDLRWTVTVAGQPSPLSTATTSYGDPTILSMSPTEGTTAGFVVTMTGINMAPSVSSSSSSMSSILLGTNEITNGITIVQTGTLHLGRSVQQVTFTIPEGVGINLSLIYRLRSESDRTSYQSSTSQTISYSQPSIDSIHISTYNDVSYPYKVIVEGTNFCSGQLSNCAVLKIDGNVVGTTEILQHDHLSISFKSILPSGTVTFAWKAPYTAQTSVSGSFSSLSPTLYPNMVPEENGCERNVASTSVECQGVATEGGTSFTVHGVRFGVDGSILSVTVGNKNAKILSADLAASLQSITFEIPPGQGRLNSVRVVVGSDVTNIGSRVDSLIRITYAPPILVSPTSGEKTVSNSAGYDLVNTGVGPKLATSGGLVRMFGTNLGVLGTVELRGGSLSSSILLSIVAWGHSEILFEVPSGYGSDYRVVLEVGGQVATSDMFRYETPVVSSYTMVLSRRRLGSTKTGGTRGGDRIAVIGTGFFTTGTATIGGVNCVVVSCNHTSLVLETPIGAGADNPLVVTVGGSVSNAGILYAYPFPIIRAALPNHAPTSGKKTGTNEKSVMILIGDNFGAATLDLSERTILFGGVDVSQHVIAVNHTHITLHVPPQTGGSPQRIGLAIDVIVKGGSSSVSSSSSASSSSSTSASTPTKFSYDPPILSSVRVVSCSFANGRSCNASFPVPTDGCHDWSFPRQRLPASELGAKSSLDRIIWADGTDNYFRTCTNPVYIELIGESLGKNTGFVATVAERQFNTSNTDCSDPNTCIHEHRRIVLRTPSGFGSPPMDLRLDVQGEISNELDWAFAPPKVEYRGTCGYWNGENPSENCRLPYNARGTPFQVKNSAAAVATEPGTGNVDGNEVGGDVVNVVDVDVNVDLSHVILEIRGDNFGHEDPKDIKIVIGSRPCKDAKWHQIHSETGRPYLSCQPEEDIVGTHAGSIFLGGQNASVPMEDEAFISTCQPSQPSKTEGDTIQYYGLKKQLCSICPFGAICTSSPDSIPISKSGFYKLQHPTFEPTTGFDNAVQKRSHDRAMGFNGEVQRCSIQQLMNSTISPELVAAYPYAERPDLCYDFVACEPSNACTGSNECNHGYQYLYHQCRAWERKRNDACLINDVSTSETCLKIFNTLNGSAMIHSSGATEGVLEDLTEYPLRYRPASLLGKQSVTGEGICLILGKQPTMSVLEKELCTTEGGFVMSGMDNRTCTTDSDCTGRSGSARDPGAECTPEHPEDCSRCVFDDSSTSVAGLFGTGTGTSNAGTGKNAVGICSCTYSTRCSMCSVGGALLPNGTKTKGFRRQDNECLKCPESAWLVVAMFCVVILLACLAAYVLNKKKFNLSFVSIGVDYFQVLSLFRNAKTKWPPQLLVFFRLLSIFMIDVDLAAPECIVPSLEYSTKWWGTMLLPIVVAVVLVLVYLFQFLYRYIRLICMSFCSTRYKFVTPDINSFIALYITFFYFLYIMLAEKGLEVFNCNPTDPDDGHTYTDFTSAKFCNGGMCRCYDASQLQSTLIAPAVILLVIYGIGFPVFVIVTILRHKGLIKEDQLLRASSLGGEPATNPYAWEIRHKYGKLYYPFKPGKIYWMEYIIGRKVGIAFAGLFFRSNPGFQLSFVLLILFASYVLQVKHRPYMSSSERVLVLEEHMMKVIMAAELEAEGIKIPKTLKRHQIFAEHLRVAREHHEEMVKKARKRHTRLDSIARDIDEEDKRNGGADGYFFDYNTVEQYLLASLILICLAGIMFESDRFGTDSAGQASNKNFEWQRELITVMVFMVIALSLIYYGMVFVAEVFTFTPACFKKWHAKKQMRKGKSKTGRNSSNLEGGNKNLDDEDIEMMKNLEEQTRNMLIEKVRQEERTKHAKEIEMVRRNSAGVPVEDTVNDKDNDKDLKNRKNFSIDENRKNKKLTRQNSMNKKGKGKKNKKTKQKKFGTVATQRVTMDHISGRPTMTPQTFGKLEGTEGIEGIKNDDPVHITHDWWLYNQNGQVYYYNTVTQTSVWDRNDIPELEGKDFLNNETKLNTNPLLMKRKANNTTKTEEAKPKRIISFKGSSGKALLAKLKAKKKAEMRIKMRQGASKKLWDKKAEERKKNYETKIRVKSKWRKSMVGVLMNKRKETGDVKGMVGLAFKGGSMLAKLKILAAEEKKKNAEEEAKIFRKKRKSEKEEVKKYIIKKIADKNNANTKDTVKETEPPTKRKSITTIELEDGSGRYFYDDPDLGGTGKTSWDLKELESLTKEETEDVDSRPETETLPVDQAETKKEGAKTEGAKTEGAKTEGAKQATQPNSGQKRSTDAVGKKRPVSRKRTSITTIELEDGSGNYFYDDPNLGGTGKTSWVLKELEALEALTKETETIPGETKPGETKPETKAETKADPTVFSILDLQTFFVDRDASRLFNAKTPTDNELHEFLNSGMSTKQLREMLEEEFGEAPILAALEALKKKSEKEVPEEKPKSKQKRGKKKKTTIKKGKSKFRDRLRRASSVAVKKAQKSVNHRDLVLVDDNLEKGVVAVEEE